ncbi:MAG: bifunctional hydroxymethylpyrimidine kinase/phosphomethylpyrimidine kinase [bacterium]
MRKALTIAGSDSGGGAGIQADLKTFAMCGVYGMSVLTAITSQNTVGVQGVFDVPIDEIERQFRSVMDDLGADAAKTGMLSHASVVRKVAELAREYKIEKLVVDPVMVSKDGHMLLEPEARRAVISELLRCAYLVTPNAEEAETLTGEEIRNIEGLKQAARLLHEKGARHVLAKGGHLKGKTSMDIFFDGKEFTMLESPRLSAKHTHGTGCTLSAAITAYLALGMDVLGAVRKGKEFVTEAIQAATPIGKGISPVNHLWRFKTKNS